MMERKLISGVIASAVAMSVAGPAAAAKPNAAVGLDNPLDEAYCVFEEGGFIAGWYDPNEVGGGDTKYGGEIEFDALLSYVCDFEGTEAPGAEGFSGSETAIVDVDLSRDESDPFSYFCNGSWPNPATCYADITGEDVQNAINEAAAEQFGSLAEECSVEICNVYLCETPAVYCEEEGGGSFSVTCDGEITIPEVGDPTCSGEWSETCFGELFVEGCAELSETCAEPISVEGNFYTFGATLDDATFSVKEMNPGHGNGKQNYEKVYAECNFPL